MGLIERQGAAAGWVRQIWPMVPGCLSRQVALQALTPGSKFPLRPTCRHLAEQQSSLPSKLFLQSLVTVIRPLRFTLTKLVKDVVMACTAQCCVFFWNRIA